VLAYNPSNLSAPQVLEKVQLCQNHGPFDQKKNFFVYFVSPVRRTNFPIPWRS
jgi:hypothetical protein